MIKVIVVGASGRMGQEVVKAVSKEKNMQVVGVVDQSNLGRDIGEIVGIGHINVEVQGDLAEVITKVKPDVMVDFTNPSSVFNNVKLAITMGVRPVVGTTGLSTQQLDELSILAEEQGVGCLIAPNFAIGAILMMQFAAKAARYMPHVEIIELHHDQKLDAPSGTALKTAELIRREREAIDQGHHEEKEIIPGSRGGEFDGMRIHSVRLPGYVAHQEVIFGGVGQSLIIRHDSINRESFMPGVVMGVNRVMEFKGLVFGLENLITD